MKIVVIVSAMAVRGDFISESIMMEAATRAIKEMNMLGIICEHTGILPESIEEIMIVPQFTEAGDGSHVVVHEKEAPLRKSQALLVGIGVYIPFAGKLPWAVTEKIGEGFKEMFKGRLYNVNIRNNDERLYSSIKTSKTA